MAALVLNRVSFGHGETWVPKQLRSRLFQWPAILRNSSFMKHPFRSPAANCLQPSIATAIVSFATSSAVTKAERVGRRNGNRPNARDDVCLNWLGGSVLVLLNPASPVRSPRPSLDVYLT